MATSLDTWFSSALWPFATLGWPDENSSPLAGEDARLGSPQAGLVAAGEGAAPSPQTSLLARHYPNDLLISGFDILFFWDARMAMQGMHFMDEVPWKRLYLPWPGARGPTGRRCPSPRATSSIRWA